MTLALGDAAPGTPLKVERILGGHRLTSRLSAMGIIPGEIVTVLQNDNGGPILLDVKGTRVALGRGIAVAVIVTRYIKEQS